MQSITLAVFFEDPYWVGLFELAQDGRLCAAKAVFGAEPSDVQVLEWVLQHYAQLRFSPAVPDARRTQMAGNPKRRLRQAAKAQAQGVGTRSQQALQLAREAAKQERKASAREEREAKARRELELRLSRKKARHRGR